MNKDEKEAKREAKKEIKAALKAARAVCKRKWAAHRRYLALKQEKKKLTRQMRAEFKGVLIEFRTLCAIMRTGERALRQPLNSREETSAAFQRGYKIGLEYAQVQIQQAELDQIKPKEILK